MLERYDDLPVDATARRYLRPARPGSGAQPWVLEVRAQEPELFGFAHVTGPEQWPQVGVARQVVADFTDPWDMLVINADRPGDVDADGLRNLEPGAAQAGDVHWYFGGIFRGPTAQAFHDQVHRAGRVLLLTGDLAAYWSAATSMRSAASSTVEVGFDRLFPTGAWTAWVPLLAHLYDDGVGTRPD